MTDLIKNNLYEIKDIENLIETTTLSQTRINILFY